MATRGDLTWPPVGTLPRPWTGVTYSYLLLLAGLASVKPDRMVLRFWGGRLEPTRR